MLKLAAVDGAGACAAGGCFFVLEAVPAVAFHIGVDAGFTGFARFDARVAWARHGDVNPVGVHGGVELYRQGGMQLPVIAGHAKDAVLLGAGVPMLARFAQAVRGEVGTPCFFYPAFLPEFAEMIFVAILAFPAGSSDFVLHG